MLMDFFLHFGVKYSTAPPHRLKGKDYANLMNLILPGIL